MIRLSSLVFLVMFLACGIMIFIDAKNISAELRRELLDCPLEITGQIPEWLSGTLIRNGPIQITIDGETHTHWFDGLAMLHAFMFSDGKMSYTNKFLHSDPYYMVFEKESLHYAGFASQSKQSCFKSLFNYIKNLISPFFGSTESFYVHNANVNVTKIANQYVALTEIPLPVQFDLKTLDTVGVFNYKDQLPKEGCWESAHPHYDVSNKKALNYLIKFGGTSYYVLYSLKDGSAEREIISEIPVQKPSYMHSFAVTEHYIILTEYPLRVNPLDLIINRKAFIKNFTWQPAQGTRFIIISRETGNIVGTCVARPFFAFHHVNAFEKDGIINIDIVTYKDATIIDVKNVGVNQFVDRCLERFSYSLETGTITSQILSTEPIEFPRINETFDGKPYRYAYMIGSIANAESVGIYKINTETKDVLKWFENGCQPGESVFVAAPDATEEDEGVILTVILDRAHNNSFLLVLDGKTFKELGRAKIPHMIPLGLHGQYFNFVQN